MHRSMEAGGIGGSETIDKLELASIKAGCTSSIGLTAPSLEMPMRVASSATMGDSGGRGSELAGGGCVCARRDGEAPTHGRGGSAKRVGTGPTPRLGLGALATAAA